MYADKRMLDISKEVGTPPEKKRKLSGMLNLGNTCYMNSILQALASIPGLSCALLEHSSHEKNFVKQNREKKLSEVYHSILSDLWDGDTELDSISTKKLRKVKKLVEQENQIFFGLVQQDSHEFLLTFLQKLHSENQSKKKSPKERPLIKSSEDKWKELISQEDSIIQNFFVGITQTTITCTNCKSKHSVYDPFWTLSLPLLPEKKAKKGRKNPYDYLNKFSELSLETKTPSTNLIEMLGEFSRGELDDYKCNVCQKRAKAKLDVLISRLPKILIFHIKSLGATVSKRKDPICFPISTTFDKHTTTENKRFDLTGIISHSGSAERGHYTATCQTGSRWTTFSDGRVHESKRFKEKIQRSKSAYLLFYEAS